MTMCRYPTVPAEAEPHCWWAESEAEFREKLRELFPGFTDAEIIAGLTVPAIQECEGEI